MKLILFSKRFATETPTALAKRLLDWGLEGVDLAVRDGHPVTPGNVGDQLPVVARALREAGLDVPMVTAGVDLIDAESSEAATLLDAMARAGVRLVKLGYWRFDARTMDYARALDAVRRALDRWEAAARARDVRVLYHVHSGDFMAPNASALARVLEGHDPAHVGAYLDAGHLALEGESFPMAVSIVRPWLAAVALKDVMIDRIAHDNHGSRRRRWCLAGDGVVNWTQVFDTLAMARFAGPLSVHAEFEAPPGADAIALTEREARWMRAARDAALGRVR